MKLLTINAIAVISAVSLLGLGGCSDDNHVTGNDSQDMVAVHGTLLGRTCPKSLFYSMPPRPFCEITGETATVFFIDSSGTAISVETNDTSNFDLSLPAASYKIAVKTGFNYPPDTTFDVQLQPGDTSLSIETHLAVLDPAMFIFEFDRYVMTETLTVEQEWAIVLELNRQTQIISGKPIPAFDIAEGSALEWRQIDGWFVVYEIPVIREDASHGELYNVVEVTQMLDDFLAEDTTGLAPLGFYTLPKGVYPCPMSH